MIIALDFSNLRIWLFFGALRSALDIAGMAGHHVDLIILGREL